MLDVRRMKELIDTTPGEQISFSKAQVATMLAEIALGNAARVTLTNVASIARLAPGTPA